MKPWSEDEFWQRVDARIAQLGKPAGTLMREAGMPGDLLRKRAKIGSRIDKIHDIAKTLRWTVGQALGLQDSTLFLDREREIDPTKLRRALALAESAIGFNKDGLASFADAVSFVYCSLAEVEREGVELDDVSASALIASWLRRSFAK